jgi:RNA polymerase II-associated factor 1
MVTKFITNPVAAGDNYDSRLDVAILRPRDDQHAYAQYQQRQAEWDAASGKPQPLPEDDYDYFLPLSTSSVRNLKRKFNVNDPENDSEDLYPDETTSGARVFKYARLRTYETYTQNGDPVDFYNDSVAMALHDPDTEVGDVPGVRKRLAKGAYFYPVMQRTALRPKRNVGAMALSQQQGNDEEKVDEIGLTIGAMDEESRAKVGEVQAGLDSTLREVTAS